MLCIAEQWLILSAIETIAHEPTACLELTVCLCIYQHRFTFMLAVKETKRGGEGSKHVEDTL